MPESNAEFLPLAHKAVEILHWEGLASPSRLLINPRKTNSSQCRERYVQCISMDGHVVQKLFYESSFDMDIFQIMATGHEHPKMCSHQEVPEGHQKP